MKQQENRAEPQEKQIRFIDSHYNLKFYIPDGGKIRITFRDGHTADRVCKYIDDYHLYVGNCWATTLRFRPFLAFGGLRKYARNPQANRDYQLVENGVKTCMYPGYPELFMQLNKKNEFHYQPDWYRGIEYPKEQERGYDFNEDLYVPGYFEVDIKKGESIIFSAGISNTQ